MVVRVCGRCGSMNIIDSPDGKLLCMSCGFRGKMIIPRTMIGDDEIEKRK
ncbi:MAG: hypothetical protein Q7K42_06485 [Candidatus Diapherotrites archaeon]|nr:hypothetical protein [Candidatus Diapherotrites archaeon]